MNHQLRRQDRKLTDQETLEILNKGEYGVLSMCTPDNEAYGIPMSYAFHKDAIYLHCALEGSKLNYIKENPCVSFCVVGKTEVLPSNFGTKYQSAIAFGNISFVEGEEKRNALLLFIEKYSKDFISEGKKYIDSAFDKVIVLKLSIEAFTGKARKG